MPGDRQSRQRYEQCVERCADSLYRVAFRLTGSHTLAGELVQETYYQAWRGLDSLTDSGRMRGWMFSILRNQYTKLIRSESKHPSSGESSDEVATLAAPRDENEELTESVQLAIDSLEEEFRMPILLVAMEGLSVDEASSALGIPRGTVLSRLHRGRKKIKQFLQKTMID